ncbi:UDP-N-acetylglucosamine--LPS N-acetylglucosamine transferase [Prauserella halophila]|uniref:UDP-N-acetylglucosamine--LPS N-acetylglucosamine transferase n=1 Tax=Prauserella halophila TaxID=185641 RepID=A0ABP4H4C0_9PSEU|nr:PssD/Cps14F family polysaccharide biosynthesis glycosyltransferase [Prauserella halophila]MCP2236792.1 Oligosaccharide biosynthesis protein Alg14 like [Prauserella halophila]
MKIMLVASTGGHLAQLDNLAECWSGHDRHWVSFDKPDAVSALEGESVTWAYHPVTRNIRNAARNLVLAVRTLRRERPDVVVSNGAGVAFPFFVVARALRVRTIYLEVFDRIDRPSLTGMLCYPLADHFCLQWEEQRRIYPEGIYVGAAL